MDWEKYMEYVRQQEEFKQMPVDEQIEALASKAQGDDIVIGIIHVQNPPEFDNRYQLNNLFGKALLVEEFAVMGQGDNEFCMIFAVNNLLIGVRYFAYWRNPFSMIRECKVYRFPKDKSLDSLDWKIIKKALFGY